MKENIKKEWVQALRSGEIPQAHKSLGYPDGSRCCLGVLCDIAVKHGIIDKPVIYPEPGWLPGPFLQYGDETSYLPEKVLEWAEIEEAEVILEEPFEVLEGSDEPYYTLSSANDAGATFAQIAHKIETDPSL